MSQFDGLKFHMSAAPISGFKKMAVLVPYTSKILHLVCSEYDWDGDKQELEKFIGIMHETMRASGGLGISAPQLGVPVRIFCLRSIEGAIINPTLLTTSDDMVLMDEGCLSYPGLIVKKKRPSTIRVRFYDQHGEARTCVYNGITARAFLHELDHLNGLTIMNNPSITTIMKFEKWERGPRARQSSLWTDASCQ